MSREPLAKPSRTGLSFKFLYTLEECEGLLSLSRSQLYRLVDQGDLQTVKIGKSRRITYTQLDAFILKLEQSKGFAIVR